MARRRADDVPSKSEGEGFVMSGLIGIPSNCVASASMSTRLNQYFRRQSEAGVKRSDHGEGERTSAC